MELCLFQGTFNPIHNAHLRIAQYVTENYNIKNILFIPAYNPPHKETEQNMAEHRLNMVKLATEDYPEFSVSDIEYKRKGKSYTYLTICELYEKYSLSEKIKFIIGTDAFRKIDSWYEADKLKDLLDFMVFLREKDFKMSDLDFLKSKGYNFEIMPLPFEDISSTTLREFIKQKKDLSKFIPKKVEEYIKENELYKN